MKTSLPVRVSTQCFYFTYNEQVPFLFHFPTMVCLAGETTGPYTSEVSLMVHSLGGTK